MSYVERMLEYAELPKQREAYWWAANSMNDGHHSGAYWVLRILRKRGKTQRVRDQATRFLIDKGYEEHLAAAAEW